MRKFLLLENFLALLVKYLKFVFENLKTPLDPLWSKGLIIYFLNF